MARLVKCAYCGDPVDKDLAEKYKNKNFHPLCCEKQKDRDDLLAYICQLFGLKAPGPIIYRQLKLFLDKYSYYTYKGIKNSLIYFYEVQKKSTEKSNNAIGIVPYVYDQAQEYFEKIEKQQERVASAIGNSLEDTEVKTIVIRKNKKKKKELYDIENL